MAESALELLFRIKAQNQASPVLHAVQGDAQKLQSAFGSSFGQMQSVATTALGRVTQSLTSVASQTPIVGTAVNALSNNFSTMAATSAVAGSSLAALAGPAVLAAAALGAMVTAAIALGKGLFDLAVSTADYAGKLFDLSKQTNFNVETLSALSLAAKDSGGSIDTVSSALGIFQANMVKAAEGNDKYAKTFRDLNIDTTNQEKALRQAISALFQMGETEKQSAEAKKLFGKAAKDVLGIIKETNGDLDAATAKYAAMGRVITTEAAASADAFNDSLERLTDQLAGFGRTIGFEVIPVLNVFFNDMSEGLTGSRAEWITWAGLVRNEVAGVLAIVTSLGQLLSMKGGLSVAGFANLPGQVLVNQRSLLDRAQAEQTALGASSVTDQSARLALGSRRGEGGGAGGGGKSQAKADEIFKAELEASKRATEKEIEQQRHLSESLTLAFEENKVTLEEYFKGRQTLVDEHFNTLIDAINREQEALDQARAGGRIKTAEAEKKDAELTQRTEEAKNRLTEDTRKNDLARQRAFDQAELDLNRQLVEIRQAQRESELARIEDLLSRRLIIESEATARRLTIEKEAQADRGVLLDLELKQQTTSADRKIELDNQKIESEEKFTTKVEELTQRRIDAINRESAANAPGVGQGVNELGVDDIGRAAGAAADVSAGTPPEQSLRDIVLAATEADGAFAGLGQTMSGVLGLGQDIGGIFGGVLTQVFGRLAEAVGDAVHAFVLFGSAGQGLKKFTATMIAEIARMAAVQAVWELAQGLAMLALNFFWPDPRLTASATKHFHSAAVYGGLAAVAAVAGRAVAGDAFAQGGSGGSTGAGNQGRNPSDRGRQTGEISPIEVNRRSSEPVRVDVHLHATVDEGVTIRTVQDNYRQGGEVRDIINHALGMPGSKG